MFELRELTIDDGNDVFDMIQEIKEGENGFVNSLYAASFSEFQEKLSKNVETAKGINLGPGWVPQTIYWLYADGIPAGYGKFRHYLNEQLLEHGGHIGYVIRPSARGKGYAAVLLNLILEKAKERGLERVLLTCDEVNIASRKTIEKNNGVLTETKNGSCYYWIDLLK